MTGRDRRQTRKLVTDRKATQPVPVKPKTNRIWDTPTLERAAAPASDNRSLTVEFTALRLLEALIRKEGGIVLQSAFAVQDCVSAAKQLIMLSDEK